MSKGMVTIAITPAITSTHSEDPELSLSREPTRVTRHLGEGYIFHLNNRVNSHCGPGPGCDSQNYDQEPPDGPTEIGLYDTHINPVPSHELNSIAELTHKGRGDAPRVTDITPSCGMVDPTPSTDELVRRLGDGWTELKEG